MGVRKRFLFIFYCFFVQLISAVPIDEASRTSIYSNSPNFINSANKLTSSSSSSTSENSFKSSSGNLGSSVNNFGSSATSVNDRLLQSFQKLQQNPSIASTSFSVPTPNTGSVNSNSVGIITDASASSLNPLGSSRSFSNAGRSLSSSQGSANQVLSALATSGGSFASSAPRAENYASVSQVSSNGNSLLDSVSDINSADVTKQSFGSSNFVSAFPSSTRISSKSNTKSESTVESTLSFPNNRNSIPGTMSLKLEGNSKPFKEDSLRTVTSTSSASNLNGLSSNSFSKAASISENSVSGANVNSNSVRNINVKPFNPLLKLSYPVGSSLKNDAILQTVSDSSASVSSATKNINSNGLRSNKIAGSTNALGQLSANGLSSDINVVSGSNNLPNNNVLSEPVSSLSQQKTFSESSQFSLPISNAQISTRSHPSNINGHQTLNPFTSSASSVSNDVSSSSNAFATKILSQGSNVQGFNQLRSNLQNTLTDTESSFSLPNTLSSASIGTQAQSISSSPKFSSQFLYPINSFSFGSDSSTVNNGIANSAISENKEVTVQTNSIKFTPNSQNFGQSIFTNAPTASITPSSQSFPNGAFENIASQINSAQIPTSAPSNVQSLSSFISNTPSLSPVNNQASFNILPNTLNLQSLATESALASKNPTLSSTTNQVSFNILPNTLNLQTTTTASSLTSNNPSFSSNNKQASFNILPNSLNLQTASTESPLSLGNSQLLSSVNNQGSFKVLPNTLNLQPLSSVNAFSESLTNAIQPALSLAENQVTKSLNNGISTEQVALVSSSTTSSSGNALSLSQKPFGVGIPQFNSGPQALPLPQITNLASYNNPSTSSLNNPLASINPSLSPNQRYSSLTSASLSSASSNTQQGSGLVTDNSVNTVVATTSSSKPTLNSKIVESSASTSSSANGFGINSQSQSQITENSVSTKATPSLSYPSNSNGFRGLNTNPNLLSSTNALGKGFGFNSQSPVSNSNTIIENSLNTVSVTSSQNKLGLLPSNTNIAGSSASINSLGSGASVSAQSSTDSLSSSIGSASNTQSSSNAVASSVNNIQDSVTNFPYHNIPINGSPNLANVQLLNSYPSNNLVTQNEAFSEQIVQNYNSHPTSQISSFNNLPTLTPQTNFVPPSSLSNFASYNSISAGPFDNLPPLTSELTNYEPSSSLSNFASSNSISAISTSSYPTDLSYTLPTSANQGNSIAVSESLSSQQSGFVSSSTADSSTGEFALPPSVQSTTLSSPSSIVISPGFTQTSLTYPVLPAPSYLPPIFVGNPKSNGCVDDVIEFIVLSEIINGLDSNCNCINNPWLAYLLTCL